MKIVPKEAYWETKTEERTKSSHSFAMWILEMPMNLDDPVISGHFSGVKTHATADSVSSVDRDIKDVFTEATQKYVLVLINASHIPASERLPPQGPQEARLARTSVASEALKMRDHDRI